jgi:putative membrane protein
MKIYFMRRLVLMMIIPLIIIGVVIYSLNKQEINGNIKNIETKDNSLDILNERFARGEINEEKYSHKRILLSKYTS